MIKRNSKLQREIAPFLKAYQRKAQAGWDPNDRGYDRNIEKKIKSLAPETLSELMHGNIDSGIPADIDKKWIDGEQIEGVQFYYNDSVIIVAGPHSGDGGAVITLLRLLSEPEYLIELGSGGDIKIVQSKMKKIST